MIRRLPWLLAAAVLLLWLAALVVVSRTDLSAWAGLP